LAKQRNDGLALAAGRFRYIVFFDDDFVPSRYWIETMIALFETNPDLICITGTVLADGIKTAGIPLQDAKAIVLRRDLEPQASGLLHDGFGPYGCNMAFRYSAIADVRFDERLPLYAWLEDSDFGGRIRHRGRLARADGLWGVHLGHKMGRGRGVTLGYSQIVNAAYLARKGSLPLRFLANIAIRNFLINLIRAFRPEPFIDRRGRLYGNFIALADVLRGRATPERAAEL
jgi:GT2 family glycosyltransferase